ncbi:MAG: DUF885 domain-containing protein [Acidobacteria bacterium]|nr:MAG: DUF885 domain-containing protein [Acidobacteriota bacterium]
MKTLLLVILSLSISLPSFAKMSTDAKTRNSSNWNQLVDSFFDDFYTLNPTQATAAGFHQHDSELEDYSRKGIENQIALANKYLTRLDAFDTKSLSSEERQDYQLLVNDLKAALLELQNIRRWEKNPDHYSSGLTQSAFVIMSRKFAPPEQRLRSLIDRENKMPAFLAAGKENLKNPPHIYTEVAIQQLPGIVGFFQKDVPEAFTDVKDQKLLAEFHNSNAAVIAALHDYEKFLKQTLLPVSNGDFRIGTENYQKKLLYDEMVDIPIDRLLQIGYDDLHRNQEVFKRVAAQVDPKKSAEQVREELQADHPQPDQLLQTFKDDLNGIRQFIMDKHIVTIPSPVPPIVEETPPFARALTFASMDTPGPYEKVAKEAFFNVTLPEKDWTKERTESFMGQFNRSTMISVAVHEVYPGHYVQFLWVPAAPSKIRKLLGCGSNAEGWAHYTEQMMLDEGYGNGDLKLRLGQIQDALLRDARYIVGISMHTGKMSFDEAIQFFQKEGYQPQSVAEVETKRGTSDPTYLVYTLGKLEITKLRDDYRQKMGNSFSLQEFHDAFLKQGFPPVKIVRETLLGDGSPTL